MATIGERIKARREELQMSQEDLAKKIGYKSRSSINKIELNLYNLRQSKIKLIADALDTTPSYIMGWNDEKERSNVSPAPLQPVPREDEKELLEHYNKLNDAGKEKLQDYAEDLSYNPKYTEDTVLKNA